jgi:hypothetical protein
VGVRLFPGLFHSKVPVLPVIITSILLESPKAQTYCSPHNFTFHFGGMQSDYYGVYYYYYYFPLLKGAITIYMTRNNSHNIYQLNPMQKRGKKNYF